MAISHWRIFTETKKPDAAHRLTTKLQSLTDRQFREIAVENYHKEGHVVTFQIKHDCVQWNATVYDVILCAQTMAQGWSISGFVNEEIDLHSTGTPMPGIKMISCFCPRPGTHNAR